MKAKLVYLWLPLGAIVGLALLIHHQYPSEQFFLNLSTELIGILVTVLYIDWLIERDRKRRKLQVRQRIGQRLREFAETFIMRLVVLLKCESTVL